jgi:hypothetical protein
MPESKSPELRVSAPEDLAYEYFDLFNVFVGPEEVVLEFGNLHRAKPGEATLHRRAVLSVSNAFKLAQSLQQTLSAMQERLREEMAASPGGTAH